MILSFNQPSFIPWGGFFCRLITADLMVLLDNTFLAQGFTFVNRNRLKGLEGETWITVPIKRKGLGRQKIKDLEIYQKEYWGKKFLATLKHLYGKSIYFDQVFKPVASIIKKKDNNFLKMVIQILESLIYNINSDATFLLQSEINVAGRGTNLLLTIAKEIGANEIIFPYPAHSLLDLEKFSKENIEIKFLKFIAPIYPQFRGDFIACLSILDMLFSLGKDCKKLLNKSFTLVDLPL